MSLITNLGGYTKPCAPAAGITGKACVTFDPVTRGNVKMPAAAPEANFAGVAVESQSPVGAVALQILGIARCQSDGTAVINPGDKVIIANALGQVKSKAIASGATLYCLVGECVDNQQISAAVQDVSILLYPGGQLIFAT